MPKFHLKACNMKTGTTWLVDVFEDKKMALYHQEVLANEFLENEYWIINEKDGSRLNRYTLKGQCRIHGNIWQVASFDHFHKAIGWYGVYSSENAQNRYGVYDNKNKSYIHGELKTINIPFNEVIGYV